MPGTGKKMGNIKKAKEMRKLFILVKGVIKSEKTTRRNEKEGTKTRCHTDQILQLR